MRLGWYINRLRSMEPAEVLHRLAEKSRKLRSRSRHEGWVRYPAPVLHRVFADLPESIARATPGQRAAIGTAADAALAGDFNALGRNWPPASPDDLFPPARWRFDPVTGELWPGSDAYAFDIDFRHAASLGDIKYAWEFNRLQLLPVLAAHHLLGDDPRPLAAIEAAIASWHEANPPFRGVGWASGIEVALRAISLILVNDLVGRRMGADASRRLGEILAASAFWLPRFPSRFSSANNHLVAELAGEALLAHAMGTDAAPAHAALAAQIERQILPDGVGAEQTPTYAAFTVELALFVARAARDHLTPLPASVQARFAAFADHVAWLGPLGTRSGDDDEGRVVTTGSEPDYARSVAAAVNGFLGRADDASLPDFRSLLIGAGRAAAAAPPRPVGLRTFTDGGLTLWHGSLIGRAASLGFDHGPLGYLSIAAHGHADALSLTLSLDGRPVLVDPGTYLYGSGGAWRTWFRSTAAHNTLNIEGHSQSTPSGPFNWSHKATAALIESTAVRDWRVMAEHDGYATRFGARHRRTVGRQGETIVVTDHLLGTPRRAEIVFQLAADLEARADGNTVVAARNGRPVLALQLPDEGISVNAGGDAPGAGGWVSPRFGVKRPAPRIVWTGEVGEAGVATVLKPL